MDIPWNPAVLEQRIGRVHRLGQRRTVRVVNFVSAGSIEARILELLKFKKSVFAGALDQDGEDVVMIGESQMKRFLKTVETVTENIEKSDPLVEQQAQREAERDEALADRAEQLERDEVSGRAFLKIPMPEPEAIQTLLSSLGALLGGLIEGQKN